MTSPPAIPSSSPQASIPNSAIGQSVAAWLVRRRVRLTVGIFVLLVAVDVLTGVKPHNVLNFRVPETVLGLSLVALGVAIRSWAAGVLHKTREVTTTGPYAVIRNPLYVGSFLIMIGYATLIGDAVIMFAILGPLAGLYFLQVLHEERTLSKKHESRWQEYARRVPRIYPRRLPKFSTLFSTWSRRDWMGSREYRAMTAALAGLVAIDLWRRW